MKHPRPPLKAYPKVNLSLDRMDSTLNGFKLTRNKINNKLSTKEECAHLKRYLPKNV